MADGVAQVQQLPGPGVKLVLLHQVPLVGDAPGGDPLRVGPEVDGLQGVQQAGVPDHAVLDDLGAAVGKVGLGEGVQGVQVAEDGPGLVEGPRQVLAVFQVDGGLAPHGGVHRRQQGGGQLEEGDPPEVGGGGKPGEVPHHAAPQGDEPVGPGEVGLGQELQQVQVGGAVLMRLPGGEDEGVHLEPRPLQAGLDLVQVEGGHMGV